MVNAQRKNDHRCDDIPPLEIEALDRSVSVILGDDPRLGESPFVRLNSRESKLEIAVQSGQSNYRGHG